MIRTLSHALLLVAVAAVSLAPYSAPAAAQTAPERPRPERTPALNVNGRTPTFPTAIPVPPVPTGKEQAAPNHKPAPRSGTSGDVTAASGVQCNDPWHTGLGYRGGNEYTTTVYTDPTVKPGCHGTAQMHILQHVTILDAWWTNAYILNLWLRNDKEFDPGYFTLTQPGDPNDYPLFYMHIKHARDDGSLHPVVFGGEHFQCSRYGQRNYGPGGKGCAGIR